MAAPLPLPSVVSSARMPLSEILIPILGDQYGGAAGTIPAAAIFERFPLSLLVPA